MVAVEVELVGGPDDGKLVVVPANPDGTPPPEYRTASPGYGMRALDRAIDEGHADDPVPVVSLAYDRVASGRDVGPAWLYQLRPPAGAA